MELTPEDHSLRRRIRYRADEPKRIKNKLVSKEVNGVTYVEARAKTVPFGYKLAIGMTGWWEPIPLELVALQRAKDYVKKGYKYEEVTDWLVRATGRKISKNGFYKTIRRGY